MIFQQCLIDSFSVPAKNFPSSLSLTPHLPSARVSYRSSNRVLSPSPFFYFLFLAHFSSSFSQFVFPTHLSSPFTQAICLVIVAAVVVIVGAVVVLVVVLVAVPVIHTFTGRSTVYPNNSFYWIRSGGSVFLIHFLDSLFSCIGLGAPSARYVFRCTHTHTHRFVDFNRSVGLLPGAVPSFLFVPVFRRRAVRRWFRRPVSTHQVFVDVHVRNFCRAVIQTFSNVVDFSTLGEHARGNEAP